jgi:L,D-peptidoglycan transpeptidase YkuD (ErfK/YbiS/YcfS/YnhG family)
MAMRLRRWLRWGMVVSLAAFLVLAALVTAKSLKTPPVDTLASAYNALRDAKAARADLYAAEMLAQAMTMLRHGEVELANENARFLPFGSYWTADSLLQEAVIAAKSAELAAKDRRRVEHESSQQAVTTLQARLSTWRDSLSRSLVLLECERLWSKASASTDLASALVKSNHPQEAARQVATANGYLDKIQTRYEQYQQECRSRTERWHGWVREAITRSSQSKTTEVVVDKAAHRLFVVTGGKVVESYPCELGFNSAFQKLVRGDGATPEGQYFITEVRQHSKYYKALMLNYPNEQDKVRYRQNIRQGVISAKGIGSLIEIHGDGGRGKDWTEGCVALENRDIDKLMKHVSKGTPVTIVRTSGLSKW